jgi:hypothetical protein
MSVAVEIEQAEPVPDHHHAIKEVQKLTVDVFNQFDTVRFTIDNMDEGYFKVIFTDPAKDEEDGNTYTSSSCYGRPTAA